MGEEIKDEVEGNTLVLNSLVELLVEKNLITEAELKAKLESAQPAQESTAQNIEQPQEPVPEQPAPEQPKEEQS